MKLTEHFSLSEFSKNGDTIPQQYQENLLKVAQNLEQLREHINFRFPGDWRIVITRHGGWRSPDTNAKVGGAMQSQHLTGNAADFRIMNQDGVLLHVQNVFPIVEMLISQGRMCSGGLHAYAKAHDPDSFTHYDVRGHNSRWV